MLKKMKLWLITFIAAALLLTGVTIALYSYTTVLDKAVIGLINQLSSDDLRISFKKMSGNLVGGVRLDQVQVILKEDTLSCKRIELDYSLMDILHSEYRIERLILYKPKLIFHVGRQSVSPEPSLPIDSLLNQFDFQALPLIDIKELIVRDGEILVRRNGAVERFEDIQIGLSAEITERKVEVRPRYIRANWVNRDLPIENISFQLLGNKKRIALNQLEARIPHLKLVGHGEVEFSPRFQLRLFADTTRLELPLIRALYPEVPFQQGYVKLYGSFLGTPGNFFGDFYLGAELDSLEIKSLHTRYSRQGDDYRLDSLRLESNFGRLSGTVEFNNRREVDADLVVDRFNLRRTGFSDLETMLNGRVQLRFVDLNPEQISGRAGIELVDSRIDRARFDTLSIQLSAKRGEWTLHSPSRVVFGPQSNIAFHGGLSRDRQIDLTVETTENQLDQLFSDLQMEQFGGAGEFRLHISGPVQNPHVKGRLYVDSLTIGASVVYGIDGQIDLKNVLEGRRGDLSLELATGFVNDVFLTSGELDVKFQDNRIFIDPFQFYSEENFVQTRAVTTLNGSDLELVVNEFKIRYNDYDIHNPAPLKIHLRSDSVLVEEFRLVSSDSGFVEAGGHLALNGESYFNAEVSHLHLAPFNQYFYWDHILEGRADAQVEISGAMDNPEVLVFLGLNDLSINGNFLGKLSSEVLYRDNALGINFFDFERDSSSYLTINGAVDVSLVRDSAHTAISTEIPLDLNLVMANFRLQDYAFLYPTNYPLQGSISGRLDLSGNLTHPRGTFNLSGEEIRYLDYYFPSIRLDGRLSPDQIRLDMGVVNFNHTIIKLNGEKAIRWDVNHPDSLLSDKHFRLRAKIDEDSLNFLGAVNPELERLTGKIQAEALLEGDYDQPRLSEAEIQVQDGRLYLAKLQNSIDEVQLRAHLEGPRLVLDEFSARSPRQQFNQTIFQRLLASVTHIFFPEKQRGDIKGSGWVDLSILNRPKINLEFSLDNTYFDYFLENTRIVVSSDNLTIAGRDTLLIAGDILINQGEVELDFAESEKNLLLSTALREEPPFLQYNLGVEIAPNFYVRNTETLNAFDLKLSGRLQVLKEPRGLIEMYGALQSDGKYFVQGEDFKIRNGKIDFINPKELPQVNLYAQKQKNNLLFNLRVTGPIDAPEKEITIQDEQGNTLSVPDVKDQIALLLFGVRFNELDTNTESLLLSKGEQVVTQAVIARIEKEARSFTGLDQVRLDGQVNFFSSRLNQPSSIALGKYLTSKLYLEYKSQLVSAGVDAHRADVAWEAGNQIYLEYRLNRHWSFTTTFQRTEEGNERVKLDISWKVEF